MLNSFRYVVWLIRVWLGVCYDTMLLDVVKLLHCHRSLGVGVYEVVWCLLSSFDTKSLAYTRLVGAYMVGIGVVKSLHCHRSLGVGLLRCWMLLVELETT